jgi:hypothetical protein
LLAKKSGKGEEAMAQKLQEAHWGGKLYDLAAGSWVLVLLLAAGIVAVVTAVLVAWPAIAYIASRYFGIGG